MLNKFLLQDHIDAKNISVQKHPDADLYLYNYTKKCQYDKVWDEVTMQCRGLILDGEMNIVARPFSKFFNLEEHKPEEIPTNIPFKVTEKMDGSLGIMYWIEDVPYIATRGSFTSDQAIHATKILHEKYSHLFDELALGVTYLFEIIYSSNRIVVDYGSMDDIVLLAIIDNESGKEIRLQNGFNEVQKFYGVKDFASLKEYNTKNKEGFVITFQNGFRVKVKFDEYIRLHKILTGVSNITIWEYMKDDKNIGEILDRVPDEMFNWVNKVRDEITYNYEVIELAAMKAWLRCHRACENRKVFALKVLSRYKGLSSVIFAIENEKDHEKIIWKMIKPKFSKPFTNE